VLPSKHTAEVMGNSENIIESMILQSRLWEASLFHSQPYNVGFNDLTDPSSTAVCT